jgi:lambda family phage portal protein
MKSLSEAFEGLRSDYNAAKASRYRRRRKGIVELGSNADFHYVREADFFRMMEAARDMDRNDSFTGMAIDRLVDNLLQSGFRLDPTTADEKVNVDLAAAWADCSQDADQVDIGCRFDFNQLARKVLRSALVDGDDLVKGTDEGSLQAYEAHQLRTPRNTKRSVVHGVLMDKNRKPLEYWVAPDTISVQRAIQRVGDMEIIKARDELGGLRAWHVYDPKRFSQTRGVTCLAPIFDQAALYEDIQFAKLVQQQIVSCFAIFREREMDYSGGDPGQVGEQEKVNLGDGSERTLENLTPGLEIFGNPGEKLHGFSPNVPNVEFFTHSKQIINTIAANLLLPPHVVLLDPSQTNFSGWRGALDQARIGWRRVQDWFVSVFHRRVYVWRLRKMIANDAALRRQSAREGVHFFSHTWQPQGWAYVEPLKEASADLLRVRNALISPRRQQAERGRNWRTVAREIVDDNGLAIVMAKEKAAELNKQFPLDPVHWRELISLPTPDGLTVSVSSELGAETSEQTV